VRERARRTDRRLVPARLLGVQHGHRRANDAARSARPPLRAGGHLAQSDALL